jgi:hypothetical protein
MRLARDLGFSGWLRPQLWLPALVLLAGIGVTGRAAQAEPPFDDPLFRKCVSWMLDGNRGALIENLCIADYSIPPPSLFICARKVLAGFESDADRAGCAVLFEEQAKRARAGWVR